MPKIKSSEKFAGTTTKINSLRLQDSGRLQRDSSIKIGNYRLFHFSVACRSIHSFSFACCSIHSFSFKQQHEIPTRQFIMEMFLWCLMVGWSMCRSPGNKHCKQYKKQTARQTLSQSNATGTNFGETYDRRYFNNNEEM